MTAEHSEEGTYDRRWERLAKRFLDMGIRPNHFTLLQVPVFVGMAYAAIHGDVWLFFGLSWLVIILDGGDGILARVGGLQSKAGAVLDSVMDTVGIAVVLWAASLFAPEFTPWFIALFVGNVLLYLQNMRFHEKVVSYVRGPIIVGVAVPDTMLVSIVITLGITLFLLFMRLPGTLAVQGPPSPRS